MAKNEELFTCSICLQLMEDPVTIGCGHSYCMKCINTYWDRKYTERAAFSCPQCRQTFTPRPTLNRNALLAELLEEHKKTSEAVSLSDDGDNLDSDEGVQCDACTGKKRYASKFCLTCLVTYCETHLEPHFKVTALRKHKLVQASPSNKDAICVPHHKLLEIYCRTDRLFICALCVIDGHKGHDTVAVVEEMCAMQKQLENTKQEVVDRIVESERKMTQVRKAANSIRGTAWEVCDEFERLCQENIRVYVTAIEKKCADVREKVGGAEKAGVDWTNNQLRQLRSEINALMNRDQQLKQLLLTEEPIQFLKGCQALSALSTFNDVHTRVDKLTEFVNNKKHELKSVCNKEKEEVFSSVKSTELIERKVCTKQDVITSRQYLSKYKHHKLELDSNTVAACLSLSDSNRELSWGATDQRHPDHTDRFTYYPQALCKQGLTNDAYWEVEWDGGIVELAVSYKGIERKGSGNHCCFGHNNLSWKLVCSTSGCKFWHNNLERALIPPVESCKLGVHLQYQEGILCFYSITSNEFALLHKTQAIFTEHLYPGFSVDLGSTLKICSVMF